MRYYNHKNVHELESIVHVEISISTDDFFVTDFVHVDRL